jgi:hypothetical protein
MKRATSITACMIFTCCSLSVPDKFSTSDAPVELDISDQIDTEIEICACTSSADCDDGEPCNGEETCSDCRCLPGTPLPDGASCRTSTGLEGTCRGGMCSLESCGNGTVNDGEECDDGNDINGDGCESNCTLSCHDSSDCDLGNQCVNGFCSENENGKVCSYTYPTGPCNDGYFCTAEDTCDGSGNCTGHGNPCDDGFECTENLCEEGSGGPACTYPVLPGFCLIAGICFSDGAENPGNSCQVCRSAYGPRSWHWKEDMTLCPGGVCCSGECRTGGECCRDSDCDEGCTGEALPCEMILNAETCHTQAGCEWTGGGGSCGGSFSCNMLRGVPPEVCETCGCPFSSCWLTPDGISLCDCGGTGPACNTFSGADACLTCRCLWAIDLEHCDGDHYPCETYVLPLACDSQLNCGWSEGVCMDYRCE